METAKETVKDRIQHRWSHTKKQFVAFEQLAKGRVEGVPEKLRGAWQDMPRQLRGAWDRAATALRKSLDLATSDDFRKLGGRIDDLARRVDRLAREKMAKASDRVVRLTKK